MKVPGKLGKADKNRLWRAIEWLQTCCLSPKAEVLLVCNALRKAREINAGAADQ